MITARLGSGQALLDGHAGYGTKGTDIVCAAVSMLVYVQLRLWQRQGVLAEAVTEPGHVELRAHGDAQPEILLLGLRYLAQEYPRCVRLA